MKRIRISWLKPKRQKVLTSELIEQKALEKVMPRAQEKARQELCQDCLHRWCLKRCKTFEIFSQVYAWDMIIGNARLN